MHTLKKIERFIFGSILIGTLAINVMGVGSGIVFAGDIKAGELPPPEVEVVNPYFTLERFTLDDGTTLEKSIINGPSEPPAEYEKERLASIQPLLSDGIIPSFPSYDWVFGCSAVSGAMIAAYYDNNGYPNMYAGPTNGGVMPLTDTSWPTWYDGFVTYPSNPLIASRDELDGRIIKGSIDDYWVKYGSTANDPYITGGWPQHTWSDAIGDYMKTSQSAYGNSDGSTAFYNWTNSSDPMTCSDMENYGIDDEDGTYGRKLFYEARGYSVGDCYNQKTDNNGGGFTLSDFQAEINAGHPVLLNLRGHSIVGYGYTGSTMYIRDTWDSNPENTHTLTWDGCLPVTGDCLELQSVSIVRLNPVTSPPSPPTGVSASDGTFTDKVRISWVSSDGADNYKVYRNTTDSTSGAAELTSSHPTSPYDDFSATPEATYYYWIKACNGAGCSGFSTSDSGYAASAVTIPSPPTGVTASDGTFTDKVRISWTASDGASYYKIFRNTGATHTGEAEISSSYPASPYDDSSATPEVTYTYWVKACNSAGCSGYSSDDEGWRAVEVTETYLFLPLVLNAYGTPSSSLINGDFEQGHIGWTEESSGEYDLIYGDQNWAHSGTWLAYLGGYHNGVDHLYQDVTISVSEPYLNFWVIIDSEDYCGYDYFYLYFGGDYIGSVSLCEDNNTPDWVHFYADLSEFAGNTEAIYFIVETDGSLYSYFYIDTVFMSASEPDSRDSSILIEGGSGEFEIQPLPEGDGFKQKDINR